MSTWTDPGPQEFDAALESGERGGSWVTVPADVSSRYRVAGRVPVLVHFDGIEYRGSIAPYQGTHRLGVLAAIETRLGKRVGDQVHVRLTLDEAEQVVVLAPDVEKALLDAGLMEKFRGLAQSHQREFATWINSAKHNSTRTGRLAKLISMVAAR
ncbi:Bacteriocin-protection, YdeI or OmpD-Associated [Nakamurella panacisegetis]|uniref:Bacteriocin-protection, YdeI or OmpD-Associated n=1 Tax=Nakamurella panacisegetis TaxID=1090615 RepID=A0A1H0PUL9_9ACTN|nr:YdeI/OmpD-associated family protein [Nakamurella panacisegetis]SDP08219.1 Bacteriocin-protection, YdeI or OmpD-Associated [Nakamurella panacisegetis]